MALRQTTIDELKKLGIGTTQINKLIKLNRSEPAPMNAKVIDMGFDPKAVAKLPAPIRNLTKQDLLSLGGWGGAKGPTTAAAKLSVADVQLIRDVLGKGPGGIGMNPVALTVNCCCCPCCCAVTVSEPVAAIEKTRSIVLG